MYKQNSEYKQIQKKLVAAVAMVLVACIMVVSSSYAWFTLSTAPEVTGITTSVGSNGNLEMALNVTGDTDDIETGTNVSMPDANKYWGNLVNLSDASYGLDKIALAPSRLNFTGNTVSDTLIYTPVYGTDGRLSQFANIAQSGKPNTSNQFVAADNWFGVRGIGTASGLSAGELALRDARSAVNSAKDEVGRLARTSLEVDAINLANLMIANLIGSKSTVTGSQLGQVQTAVTNLDTIADKLEAAMDSVVNAAAIAATGNADGVTTEYTDAGATITGVTLSAELKASMDAAAKTLTTMRDKIDAAQGDLDTATTDKENPYTDTHTYDYSVVESVMGKILSKGDLKIGGNSMDGMGMSEMVTTVRDNYFANDGKLPLDIVSGIYKEIADFIGTYSASAKTNVDLTETAYDELGELPVTLVMKVETAAPEFTYTDAESTTQTVQAYYLSYFITQLSNLDAFDSNNGGNTETILSDLYAFAIDLAFRTNAAGSNLMLQTTPVSRVGDDTTASVQGSGSYMEFTIGDAEGYTIDQMVDLMGAIRVVLYNTETNEIYGIAALDINQAERTETTAKAYLYLYAYTQETSGKLVLGDKVVTDNTDGTQTAITGLTQNQALALTALVYLDGDYVDNTDVAINGNSMTGTLNLQFSSDADLEPMDYTFTETPTQKLDAPTATLTDGSLVITPATGAPTGVKYDVYTTIAGQEFVLKEAVDAGTYNVAVGDLTGATEGDYDIYVRASLTGYTDSDGVKAGTITVPAAG